MTIEDDSKLAPAAPHPRLLDEIPLALDVATTAGLLGVSEWSVYKAVGAGQIGSIRIGRSIRIPRSALIHLLAGGTDEVHAPSRPEAIGNE